MQHTILIAEDDRDITELLTLYLTGAGYAVRTAEDGAQALAQLHAGGISLVLADIMMPGLSGYELIRQARSFSDLPIIILSARTMDADRLLGLDVGADAYLTKPFNPLEVVAYVKAALRRCSRADAGQDTAAPLLRVGALELDTAQFTLRKNGQPVPLTSTELKILAQLMRSPGRVFTREVLLAKLWGYDFFGDERVVDSHIKNLRHKLGVNYIETVRGAGYRVAKENP